MKCDLPGLYVQPKSGISGLLDGTLFSVSALSCLLLLYRSTGSLMDGNNFATKLIRTPLCGRFFFSLFVFKFERFQTVEGRCLIANRVRRAGVTRERRKPARYTHHSPRPSNSARAKMFATVGRVGHGWARAFRFETRTKKGIIFPNLDDCATVPPFRRAKTTSGQRRCE